VTLFLIILCLFVIFALFAGGGYVQYRRSRSRYEKIAASLCDAKSWQIRFRLRTLLIRGKVDGYRVGYTVFGDGKRNDAANSYLLLECPVRRNFRFYAGSDPDQVDLEIRGGLDRLQDTPGFRGLLATSKETPMLARLISRPMGFGYAPGLLLWRWGGGNFDPETVRHDYDLLRSLERDGI
jgi:hypothetical protein